MTVSARPMDVWNLASFDPDLVGRLAPYAALAVDYYRRDQEIFLTHELGRGSGRQLIRPSNAHAAAFQAFREGLIASLERWTIRAWHYTRLTDEEVDGLRRKGVHLSAPETFRRRLDALVSVGALTTAQAAGIIEESPFQTSQLASRRDKFWMNSHPVPVDDSGVGQLLSHWGGEGANMFLHINRPDLLEALAAIGRPRIIEVAVPLAFTQAGYSAAEAVVATFARAQGAIPAKHDFDLYVTAPLGPAAILAVHSEGEPAFVAMGVSHPPDYVDVSVGWWKALTGDDD